MTAPPTYGSVPVALARWLAEKMLSAFCPLPIWIGVPVWNVAMPLTCQPPSTKFNGGGCVREEHPIASERKVVIAADDQPLRDVLRGDGAFRRAIVEVLLGVAARPRRGSSPAAKRRRSACRPCS